MMDVLNWMGEHWFLSLMLISILSYASIYVLALLVILIRGGK